MHLHTIGKSAIKVSLLELLDAPIEAITSLENYDLVALDDIEAISGVPHWQKAILKCLEKKQTNKTILSQKTKILTEWFNKTQETIDINNNIQKKIGLTCLYSK